MNFPNDTEEYFLSWQGQITGPHSLREINSLLKLGKIHSLYRVQVEGQWLLLRDHLATIEHGNRKAAAPMQSVQAASAFRQPEAFKPIVIPDADESDARAGPFQEDIQKSEPPPPTVPKGIAITAFILSLFFFVPFLNGITWLLALIFGHLALSCNKGRPKETSATLAWTALWITYVEIGFFLIALAWVAVTETMPLQWFYFLVHGQMLASAIGALIGAGVLMLAIKLAAGQLVGFLTCYIGVLAPSAASALGVLILQMTSHQRSFSDSRTLILAGLLNMLLFVGQAFFWSKFIVLDDGSVLGFARAVMASILCTFVSLLVAFGYVILFTALAS